MALRSSAYKYNTIQTEPTHLRQGLPQAVHISGHLFFLFHKCSPGFVCMCALRPSQALHRSVMKRAYGFHIHALPILLSRLPQHRTPPLTQLPCPWVQLLQCRSRPHSVFPPGCGHAGGCFFHW